MCRVVWAAAVIALLAGCAPRGFHDACASVQRGELVREAAPRLEHGGGEYLGKSGHAYLWRAGWVAVARCEVEDDQQAEPAAPNRYKAPPIDARVVQVRYVEGR